jgi:hypothetical protein
MLVAEHTWGKSGYYFGRGFNVNESLRRIWTLVLLGGVLVVAGGSATGSLAAPCPPGTALAISPPAAPLPFAAEVGTPFGVTVTAKDGCGSTVKSYKGPALLTASGGGIAAQTLTFTQGVATASVTALSDASGVKLTATDSANTSITGETASFAIYDDLAVCTTDDGCSGEVDNLASTGTSLSASIPGKANLEGVLGLSLSGHNATISCELADGTTKTSPTIGSLQTVAPPASAGPVTVTLKFGKDEAPGTGVANFVHCAGGDLQSLEQLLPCPKKGAKPAKCILDQRRNGVGQLVVTELFSGDPVGGTFG